MYNLDVNIVAKNFNTNLSGLALTEAKTRLKQNGLNKLKDKKKKNWFQKFLAQFKDVLIIILLLSCVFSLILSIVQKSKSELLDAIIIMVVVLFNAIIGLLQEFKAENAMDALKNMTKPYAKVLRDKKLCVIKTEEIVVGDVVLLEAGDIVPADLRLFESASLQVEESTLTGESFPVNKNVEAIKAEHLPLGDRTNLAYMGSVVTYGRGKGIVVATGMNTEMGKIATSITEEKEEPTPLSKKIEQTNILISFIVLIISAVIFITGLVNHESFISSIMLAIAIAVCAIPEGLPACLTITMAMSVQKMSKNKAIVKKLPAVEALGSTEIICSDKTGTLTINKMTVERVFMFDKESAEINSVSSSIFMGTNKITINAINPAAPKLLNFNANKLDIKEQFLNNLNLKEMLNCMLLCNDTVVQYEGQDLITIGDPTETALVHYGYSLGYNKDMFDKNFARVGEIPFDSSRKLMSTINKVNNNLVTYTKGAIDNLINICSHILDNGTVREITEHDKKIIFEENKSFSVNALRVLGYAYKNLDLSIKNYSSKNIENNLIFIGISGMIDPPREEVKESIKMCKEAGIETLMITGDHKDTAFAIAKKIGIANNPSEVITGEQLNRLSDEQLLSVINNYKVFARVNPEHKVRIVKAFKSLDKVIAMTGDGVNDAASIKAADIGVGMGITGTDVTKGVADIILTDDNFSTIVNAVQEGRKVYSNILKIIQFLLGTCVGEIIVLVSAICIFRVEFFTPALILWINLVSDSLPALALGMEKEEADIMKKPPKRLKGSLLSGRVGFNILYYGAVIGILTLSVYFISKYVMNVPHIVTVTMCFITLTVQELIHSFNAKSDDKSVLKLGIFNNKWLNLSMLVSIALTVIVVALPFPAIQNVFGITSLTWLQWLISLSFAIAIIPVSEITKFIINKYKFRKLINKKSDSKQKTGTKCKKAKEQKSFGSEKQNNTLAIPQKQVDSKQKNNISMLKKILDKISSKQNTKIIKNKKTQNACK